MLSLVNKMLSNPVTQRVRNQMHYHWHLKIPALKKLLRSHVRPLHIFQNSNSNPLSLRTEKIEKKVIGNVEELKLTSKRWADIDSNSESSEDI